MSKKLYELVAKVMNVPVNSISDNSGPESIESWTSFKGYVLLYELETEFKVKFTIDEANVYKMGREKNIRLRIRKGKIQRRVVKSATPGYVYRGEKLVRMTPQERRHRKMAQRTAKFKRRHELQQSIRKRKVAFKRRKALGV